VQAGHVWSVLLGRGGRGPVTGARLGEGDVPAECARQDLLQITLPAGHGGPVRKRDPNRGHLRSRLRRLGIGGPEIEEVTPLPRILSSPDLPRGAVDDGELPVPEQASV